MLKFELKNQYNDVLLVLLLNPGVWSREPGEGNLKRNKNLGKLRFVRSRKNLHFASRFSLEIA
jgi:hypothetical protein